ncbi:MAG: PQQ-dependent sugar dehydrogenase [Croceibacterium sp.]
MKRTATAIGLGLFAIGSAATAQNAPTPAQPAAAAQPSPAGPRQVSPPVPPFGDGPWDVTISDGRVHVEVMTKGLDHPWGMAFAPDGSILVTERPGRLRIIRAGKLDPKPIEGLLPVYATGISGLTDVALDPDFAANRFVYLAYSKAAPDTPPGTSLNSGQATAAVMRGKWDGGDRLTEVRDFFVADAWYGKPPLPTRCCGQGPASGSFGGRLALDGKGHIFITSGDRNYGERVQDPSNHFGKILRLNLDGSVPRDNPWVGKKGMKPEVWSTGHRNQLGLFYDAPTGRLWESEFGPRGGDEINLITKGGNYGWIDVTQGIHYNSEPTHKGVRNVAGYIDPVWAFPPSGNPGNVAIYRGGLFPSWQGDLLLPNMSRPPSLLRMKIAPDGHVVASEALLTNLNQRLRDVRVGPDGAIYVLTDETNGAVLKLTPAPPAPVAPPAPPRPAATPGG